MPTAIKVENLSKAYQLGEIGTGTISRDLERYWAKLRGKEDPFLRIGETNDRSKKGESDIVWSLKDINFEINQGDAVGIIGRNGAGKSTLLKILSRVTSPTTGSVKVKGRIASLLEVGTGFHPELTGRENIFLNGAILGMRKAEIKKHFDAIVDFAGVERYIDTPVKRYSSGMYVRLAFAVAAHLESEILVVDEVLAVGDAEFQKKCLGKMGDLSKGEGRTVLFVSHNMGAVKQLCTNGIVLKEGKLFFQGPIDSVIDNYNRKEEVQRHEEYKHLVKPLGVKIEKITINKSYEPTISIYEKIKIRVLIDLVDSGLKEMEVFFIIYDQNGDAIFSFFQRDTFKLFETKNLVDNNINIEFDNQFAPGKYSVSVGIFNKNKEFVDWVDSCEEFYIENTFVDGRAFDQRIGKILTKNVAVYA